MLRVASRWMGPHSRQLRSTGKIGREGGSEVEREGGSDELGKSR